MGEIRKPVKALTGNNSIKQMLATMKISILLALLSLITTSTYAGDKTAFIKERVTTLSSMLTDGVASLYEESMVIKEMPLNEYGQKITATAVLFDISDWGGGNGSRQYLAIFKTNTNEDLVAPYKPNQSQLLAIQVVGESSKRHFEKIARNGSEIILTGMAWSDKDAHCCPSKAISVHFRFENQSIIELVTANKALKSPASQSGTPQSGAP